jgi:hypothetical protein
MKNKQKKKIKEIINNYSFSGDDGEMINKGYGIVFYKPLPSEMIK